MGQVLGFEKLIFILAEKVNFGPEPKFVVLVQSDHVVTP